MKDGPAAAAYLAAYPIGCFFQYLILPTLIFIHALRSGKTLSLVSSSKSKPESWAFENCIYDTLKI